MAEKDEKKSKWGFLNALAEKKKETEEARGWREGTRNKKKKKKSIWWKPGEPIDYFKKKRK